MEAVNSSSTETKRCGVCAEHQPYKKPDTSSSAEIKRCGVCTGYLSGQPFMTSECAHTFHVSCYQHHSNKNQTYLDQTCPVCNARWTSTSSSKSVEPEPPRTCTCAAMRHSSSSPHMFGCTCASSSLGHGFATSNFYGDPYSFGDPYYSYGAPMFGARAARGSSSFRQLCLCCLAGIFFFWLWGLRAGKV